MFSKLKTALVDNGIWFTDFRKIHDIIGQAIKLWMDDAIPEVLYEEAAKTATKYTVDDKIKQLKSDKSSTEQSLKQLDESIKQKKSLINTKKFASQAESDTHKNE